MTTNPSCLIVWPYTFVSAEMSVAIGSGIFASLFAFALGVGYERWKGERTKRQVLRSYREGRVALFEALDQIDMIAEVFGSGSVPSSVSSEACLALCAFRATVDWAAGHQNYFDHKEWRQICLTRDYLAVELPITGDHRGRQLFNLETNPSTLVSIRTKLRSFDEISS